MSEQPLPSPLVHFPKGEDFDQSLAAASRVIGAADNLKASLDDANNRADQDPKTGLMNFPAFEKMATEIIAKGDIPQHRAQKYSLLLGDLDDFKKLNTVLGYTATDDQCLLPVADIFKESVSRAEDKVSEIDHKASRFGGEEFVVLLSGTDAEGAQVVADRIKQKINEIRPTTETGDVLDPVGISMGIATFDPRANFLEQFNRANDAVKYAKDISGKNQIVSYDQLPPATQPE